MEVAADWARRGPRLVVLTRGAEGSDAHWASGGRHRVPAHPVRVVDTIGAGDAFMAGLLAGLLSAGLLGTGGPAGDCARPRTAVPCRPRWPAPRRSPRGSRL
ncbi:carbohydrate kinase family protein [Actinacidiphila sp. bgisy160]|uniref:carbohydrate kinase family protein n=1 Tax=Actinacidiphila sp. bgisy160 TaxID=3413796 RepID=UPI003D750B83